MASSGVPQGLRIENTNSIETDIAFRRSTFRVDYVEFSGDAVSRRP